MCLLPLRVSRQTLIFKGSEKSCSQETHFTLLSWLLTTGCFSAAYPYELLPPGMLENVGLKYDANELRIMCLTSLQIREILSLSHRLALALTKCCLPTGSEGKLAGEQELVRSSICSAHTD